MTNLDDTLQARQDDVDWQRQQIGFDELSSGVTIRGLEYWNALRGARRFATRKNVNPRDVSPLLRNIWIVRVQDGGEDFEYRIAGDVVMQLHGPWLPNSSTTDLDVHFPGYGRLVKRIYLHIYHAGKPLALRGEVRRQPRNDAGIGTLFKHETPFVPLGDADNEVDHILGFCDVGGEFWQPRQPSTRQFLPEPR